MLTFGISSVGMSQINLGVGATYINDLGVQVRADIPMESFTLIPKASYFFVDNVTVLKFDADLAFNIGRIGDENPIYVFGGPTLFRTSANGNSNSDIGINAGAGARFSNLYIEAFYSIFFCDNCSSELGFAAGYMF